MDRNRYRKRDRKRNRKWYRKSDRKRDRKIDRFLEKAVYYRVQNICGDNISDFQSGGVARNGCIQQIIRVVDSVEANT